MLCALLLASTLAAAPPGERPVLMVLYFDNQTGDPSLDVMRKGLADMLITDLVSLDEVSVVEREKLEAVLGELKLQQKGAFDPATRVKLGKLVGAKYQLSGSMLSLSPDVSLEARLVELGKNEVKVTARVKGPSARLFELEQELVAKLSAGMQAKLGAGVGTRTKVDSVDALLAYSAGIDAADRGDTKAATSSLGKALRAAPGFTLAKESYARIMERMAKAESRRETLLGEQETELADLVDTALRGGPPAANSPRRDDYVAYRVLAGMLHLGRVKALVGPDARTQQAVLVVPPSKRDAVREELRAWFSNTKTLLAELEALGPVSCSPRLSPRVQQLATALGLGTSSTVFCRVDARVDAAEFVLQGTLSSWDLFSRLRPTLAELDPAIGAEAVQWYAKAAKQALPAKLNRAPELGFLLLELEGDAQLRLGHAEQAIGAWQDALDTFPTNPRFKDVQEKIQVALGVSAADREMDKAIATCEPTFNTQFVKLQARLADYAPGKLVEKASAYAKACKATRTDALMPMLIQGSLQNVAVMLLGAGACEQYRELADLAASYDPSGRKFFEQHSKACWLP